MNGKNLLDTEKEINNAIAFINSNDEHIVSVELNQYTMDSLNKKGIYGFGLNGEIKIIINNTLNNNEIKFNKEDNKIGTEYVPYKELNL